MRIRPAWGLWWLALIALVGCGSPVADGRSSQAEDFRVGPVVPPIPPQPPASASGCDDLAWDDERPTPIRRRVIAAPERPVPFFSRRVGVLPGDGPATVAGVRLPRGSRCPHYWATDAPVPDAIKLARRLAAAFPDTGLWPVLSNLPEDLDHYAIFTSDPARADRLDARAVLLAAWSEYLDAPERFPGLAPGSPGARAAADPFGTLARARTSESGWVLILVPAHRPADVISMVGSVATEVMPDEALTAVVRSWEERFRAVVTTIGPGMLGLSVGAPPRSPDQALTLAAELTAFSPEDEEVMGPDDLPALARRLRSGPPDPTVQSRDFWEFGWPD
jgi:uncharacterized protein DUF4253